MLQIFIFVLEYYCLHQYYITNMNYKYYTQIIERIGPIRQHQAGHQRPVFVYQIQTEGALDQVVQARV